MTGNSYEGYSVSADSVCCYVDCAAVSAPANLI